MYGNMDPIDFIVDTPSAKKDDRLVRDVLLHDDPSLGLQKLSDISRKRLTLHVILWVHERQHTHAVASCIQSLYPQQVIQEMPGIHESRLELLNDYYLINMVLRGHTVKLKPKDGEKVEVIVDFSTYIEAVKKSNNKNHTDLMYSYFKEGDSNLPIFRPMDINLDNLSSKLQAAVQNRSRSLTEYLWTEDDWWFMRPSIESLRQEAKVYYASNGRFHKIREEKMVRDISAACANELRNTKGSVTMVAMMGLYHEPVVNALQDFGINVVVHRFDNFGTEMATGSHPLEAYDDVALRQANNSGILKMETIDGALLEILVDQILTDRELAVPIMKIIAECGLPLVWTAGQFVVRSLSKEQINDLMYRWGIACNKFAKTHNTSSFDSLEDEIGHIGKHAFKELTTLHNHDLATCLSPKA